MSKEQIFIIQPLLQGGENADHDEAVALVESADAVYAGSVFQNIKDVNPATYIGSGKVKEITERLKENGAETVLFNGALTPSQTLNLSKHLDDVKVIDRTTLILDIFAQRAKSAEGKLQVELAQLKYIYPRLKGKGEALSRLGGGIGTRGPGETKLETDRRHIKNRINTLETQLSALEKRRKQLAVRRSKNDIKNVALVGYTNTGKSTLLNALTDAGTYTENKLFATLDPLSRMLQLENFNVLFTDTVGFINNLPHDLVKAFKSTLESAVNSGLNLIVCDATADFESQMKTTLTTLDEIGCKVPYLVVINKCDEAEYLSAFPKDAVCISAKTKAGIDKLIEKINEFFSDDYSVIKLKFPYAMLKKYMELKKYVTEEVINYLDDEVYVTLTVAQKHAEKFSFFADRG